MPVTSTSDSVDCAAKSGAGAWIGRYSLESTGPFSSTGSPTTLRMRPRVPSPTGTWIAWPVSVTFSPRTRPSVESMAMVRTVDSPRCWATSSTRRLPLFSVSSAFRISGRWSWNWTSTTAPMTWVILPTAALAMGVSILSERLGARDDLDEFGGDRGLARAVVDDGQPVDHVAGVAGGVVHRAHPRALLGRAV